MAAVIAIAALVFALDIGGLRTRLTGGAGAAARPFKLAVLPFGNLTGDPEQEIISDGVTQDMTSELGRLHTAKMNVIGFISAMRYKKKDTPIEQIGRELGVSYVLGGSCRREASRIVISAELIQIRDQTQLWTETYDREMSGFWIVDHLYLECSRPNFASSRSLRAELSSLLTSLFPWGNRTILPRLRHALNSCLILHLVPEDNTLSD
ncbi:MAG: hypothetical protein WBC70_02620 [Candidatus Aminicenantales bacterium]